MGKVMFYPIGIHFNNYVEVLKMERLGMAAWVSLARTVLGTLLALVGASYMAYLFTKQNMWKRKLWYRLVIATMYFSAGLIPGYMNMRMLGLVNTFWEYVIPGIFPVYNMILIKTYMESISPALEESASIDGADIWCASRGLCCRCAFPFWPRWPCSARWGTGIPLWTRCCTSRITG